MLRTLRRVALLCALATLAISDAASAQAVPYTVTADSLCCGTYGNSGNYTVTFAKASEESMTVSATLDHTSNSDSLAVSVNGSQVSSQWFPTDAAEATATSPKFHVNAGDTVTATVGIGWWGNRTTYIKQIAGNLAPWANPDSTMFGAPGNWATTPIPQNVQTQSGQSPYGILPLSQEVPKEIAGEAAGYGYVNEGSYSAPFYYQPLSTPLQPVKLCQWWSSPNSCVANAPLWRMFMGLGNTAQPNWATGQCASNCTYIGGGVAMTSDVIGANGTDRAAVVCLGGGDSGDPPWTLPNFMRPDGQQMEGNCWEMWDLRKDPSYDPTQPVSPANTEYEVAFGMHETGFIQQLNAQPIDNTYGHQLDTFSGKYCPRTPAGQWKCGGMTDALAQTWFGSDVLTPGAADSTTMLGATQQGVTASELPLIVDVVQQNDCQRILDGNATDFGHAIGIQLTFNAPRGHGYNGAMWPAGNEDGQNGSHMAVEEGDRLFFPASVAMPSGFSRAAQAFFHTVQTYGIVDDDTTGGGTALTLNSDGSYASGGSLNIRVQPPVRTETDACSTLGMGSALNGIPWSQLQLIQSTRGNNDSDPNPTP